MSNVGQLIAATRESLKDLVRQTNELGAGLQRVSPLQSPSSNLSIQYLLAISKELDLFAAECDSMMLSEDKTKKE